VVISGLPGTGKTTIAEPLAAALGYVFIAKDDIEETLYDALMAKPMISFVRGSTQSVIFLHFCTAVNTRSRCSNSVVTRWSMS
jgi:broad-specificity NMP kinase